MIISSLIFYPIHFLCSTANSSVAEKQGLSMILTFIPWIFEYKLHLANNLDRLALPVNGDGQILDPFHICDIILDILSV